VAVALVVSLATAGIAVGVVLSGSWGSRGNRRVGGATASLDCKVVVDSLLHSALLSLAAVSPKPAIVGAPVADGEGHTVSEVAEHLGSAVLSHPDAFSVLAKGDAEVTAGANIHSDVDVFISVDLEVVAGTVSVVVEDVFGVEPAVTTPVAVAVVPLAVGGIARVGGSLPGVQVSLLDIELRAPVASTLVAVTVVVSVGVPEVTWRIFSGGLHEVKGLDATAVGLAEVYIVFNGTTEKVRGVDPVGVDRGGLKEHGSLVVGGDDDGGAVGLATVHADVEGLGDTVLGNLDGGETIFDGLGLERHGGGGEESRDESLHAVLI
jgi:hypothetical protein